MFCFSGSLIFFEVLFIIKTVYAVPPKYCMSPLNISDCGQSPTPVFSYYKPGSRCEIEIWRGCPSYNRFESEFTCSYYCIGRVRFEKEEDVANVTTATVETTTTMKTTTTTELPVMSASEEATQEEEEEHETSAEKTASEEVTEEEEEVEKLKAEEPDEVAKWEEKMQELPDGEVKKMNDILDNAIKLDSPEYDEEPEPETEKIYDAGSEEEVQSYH